MLFIEIEQTINWDLYLFNCVELCRELLVDCWFTTHWVFRDQDIVCDALGPKTLLAGLFTIDIAQRLDSTWTGIMPPSLIPAMVVLDTY